MFLDNGNVEVVTGVNLPMVIKLAGQTSSDSLIENGATRLRSWTPGNLFGRRSAGASRKKQRQIMIERTLLIKARLGLHARAAAKLVRVASGFQSQVLLRRAESEVTADAKSNPERADAAASRGTELQVRANE